MQHQSCQSKHQGNRTERKSHAACNFLEAIKLTPFNSFSTSYVICTLKLSFSPCLPSKADRQESTLQNNAEHLLISQTKTEYNGVHVHSVRKLKILRQYNFSFTFIPIIYLYSLQRLNVLSHLRQQ